MEWAAVHGMRDGAAPDSRITCEQLVTMLWKYQGSPVTALSAMREDVPSHGYDAMAASWWPGISISGITVTPRLRA